MRHWIVVASVLAVSAQRSTNHPSFEVASVKPATEVLALPPFMVGAEEARMRFQGGPGTKSPERIDYIGVTLRMLIQRAYDLMPEQVVGPDWLTAQRYTIRAKVPLETTGEQLRFMLQDLLTERFRMRTHHETRSFHVYHLVVSKNGLKLRPPAESRTYSDKEEMKKALLANLAAMKVKRENRSIYVTDDFYLNRGTIAQLIDRLSPHIDRPIIDATRLEGSYALSLEWLAEGARPNPDLPPGPSIFAALREQLGLELQPATEDLGVFVVDSAEKMPTEN